MKSKIVSIVRDLSIALFGAAFAMILASAYMNETEESLEQCRGTNDDLLRAYDASFDAWRFCNIARLEALRECGAANDADFN